MSRTTGGFLSILWQVVLTIARGVIVAALFVIGAILIYGFGAGYFGHVAVPTPFNLVVSLLLLALLVAGLRKFLLTTR
jgi:hypothetical protein